MVSRSLSVRMTLLASFALIAMMAVSVRAQDPFSLEFKSSRPLPEAKAKAPDMLPAVLPEAKKGGPPPKGMPLPERLASLIELKATVDRERSAAAKRSGSP